MEKELKKIPLARTIFADIINGGFLYVDKTAHKQRMVEMGQYYFLSCLRRFGKRYSLGIMCGLFQGNRELFEWLAVEDGRDCLVQYLVLRLVSIEAMREAMSG